MNFRMPDKSTDGRLAAKQLHGVMPRRQKLASPVETLETARYIAEMAAQLALLATAANFELLAYFLDMARIEGELAVQRGPSVTLAGSPPWPTGD